MDHEAPPFVERRRQRDRHRRRPRHRRRLPRGDRDHQRRAPRRRRLGHQRRDAARRPPQRRGRGDRHGLRRPVGIVRCPPARRRRPAAGSRRLDAVGRAHELGDHRRHRAAASACQRLARRRHRHDPQPGGRHAVGGAGVGARSVRSRHHGSDRPARGRRSGCGRCPRRRACGDPRRRRGADLGPRRRRVRVAGDDLRPGARRQRVPRDHRGRRSAGRARRRLGHRTRRRPWTGPGASGWSGRRGSRPRASTPPWSNAPCWCCVP